MGRTVPATPSRVDDTPTFADLPPIKKKSQDSAAAPDQKAQENEPEQQEEEVQPANPDQNQAAEPEEPAENVNAPVQSQPDFGVSTSKKVESPTQFFLQFFSF